MAPFARKSFALSERIKVKPHRLGEITGIPISGRATSIFQITGEGVGGAFQDLQSFTTMADPEVRFPETYVSGVPVWAKRRKRSAVHPLLILTLILLALFGAVVIGVSLRLGSVEKGGAVIDQWLAMAMTQLEIAIKKF
jgi:hypothetical protein